MTEERYEPVSCDYHDELEAAAMHKKRVELEFDLEGVRRQDFHHGPHFAGALVARSRTSTPRTAANSSSSIRTAADRSRSASIRSSR